MAAPRISLDVDYLVREYRAGRSVLDLSRQLGVSRNVIDRRLIGAGEQLRTMSEANSVRMSKLSAVERAALAANAHDAIRGTKRSFESKVKNAIAKMASGAGMSEIEAMVSSDLKSCCIDTIPQLAIGPYNCDLAAFPVAVEVFGGNWHFSGRHLARTEERIRYLGDAGWHVLMLVVCEGKPRYTYGLDTGNYLVSYIKEARSNPSAPREYRVIDCRGNTLSAGRCDDDHISIKPAFANSRNTASGRYDRIPG
jgi:hypothetical protein